MAVAINNSCLVQKLIPGMQKELDLVAGGGRRFQIHRVCVYATILSSDSELGPQLPSPYDPNADHDGCMAKVEALNWQADPDDDLSELEVLHHLRQQAAAVPFLSSVISRSNHSNAATTLSGSALSPSIKAMTQGRLLSSFHRYSRRQSQLYFWYSKRSYNGSRLREVIRKNPMSAFLPHVENAEIFFWLSDPTVCGSNDPIVWESPPRDDHCGFWQVQVDVIDLLSRRTHPTSRPGKRRRTAFNPFLQLSDSPVVEDTSRGNPLPHARRFKGVRYRPDRRTWVAEMKPPKHKTKQDFGNFKSEAEAAHAVDAAFHHYGRPDLLNFPGISLQFLSTRPKASPGLDEKAKVKFVKEEAKLLLATIAATSSLHSTHTNSLQNLELSASPSRHPSGYFRSPLSEISLLFSCSGPDKGDDFFWLDSLIRSAAPTYSRSPSPGHFQDEIANALLEKQSLLG